MEHPRIALLRSRILKQHDNEKVRRVLLKSIEYFSDSIVCRWHPAPDDGRDNAKALPPAALSGMMERALQEKCGA